MISVLDWRFLVFSLVFSFSLHAQVKIEGRVVSTNDSLPIPGASVYFDGTSIGVSSGDEGLFSINTKSKISSPLIIAALGYKTHILPNVMAKPNIGIIYLEETKESLGEVHLETDPWSRQKKLEIFRREFLGNDRAALQCRIKNEEAIDLRYIPSTQTLIAFSDEPLKIINRYLGYEITYNLTDFKVDFSTASGLRLTTMVYYEGYSFFKELRKKPSARLLKNREKAFRGSSLHFMRSLASQQLVENNFRIFFKSYEVLPYSYFRINQGNDLVEVELLGEKIILVYEPLVQSTIQAEGKFYIDRYGNYTPPQNVLFSGEMSKSRVSQMLPLNYNF